MKPSNIAQPLDEQWREQFAWIGSVTGIIVALFFIVLNLPLQSYANPIALSGCIAAYLTALHRLRQKRMKSAGYWLTNGSLFCFVLSIGVDGGFPITGAFYWLPLISIIALVLIGYKESIYYAIVSMVVVAVFYGIAEMGIALPRTVPLSHHLAFTCTVVMVAFATQHWLVLILGTLQHKTHKELEKRQDLLTNQVISGEKLSKELYNKNIDLERLHRQQREMMYMVSHDLKNPLLNIRAMTDIICLNAANGGTPEYVQAIGEECDRALEFIQEIMQMGNLEERIHKPYVEQCDVVQLTRAVVHSFKTRAQQKNITFHLKTPASLMIEADVLFVKHILENLCSNALKFSPTYRSIFVRLLISIRPATTTAGVNHHEEWLRLEIQDQGPGITKSDSAKLFQKFARLSATPTGGEHSSGLGLAIVKQLVDALGGEITCESEPNKGACFILQLPRKTTLQYNGFHNNQHKDFHKDILGATLPANDATLI